MHKYRALCGLALTVVVAGGFSSAAAAADIEFNASAVSDFRFRGVSWSDGDPAIQGGVTLTTGPFSFDVWASNIAETDEGADVEVDLMATLSGEIGQTSLSGAVVYYTFPGDGTWSYVELLGEVVQEFGNGRVSLSGGYVPSQKNTWHESGRYIAVGGEVDTSLATLFGSLGRESGTNAPGGKWDWQIGAKREVGPVEVSLSYVDTDRTYRNEAGKRMSGPTALLSLGVIF